MLLGKGTRLFISDELLIGGLETSAKGQTVITEIHKKEINVKPADRYAHIDTFASLSFLVKEKKKTSQGRAIELPG